MKCFIVTAGDYSAYHICAVFSTEEKAKDWIERLKETKPRDEPEIQE